MNARVRDRNRVEDELNLFLSLGQHAADSTPQRISTTWAEFTAWVAALPRVHSALSPDEYAHLKTFPSKSPEGRRIHADKDGSYVCLADFGGSTRDYSCLLHSSGVPLDFDSGRVTASDIITALAGTTYLAFTTYAHQPGAERWRVFVPTSRPMTAEEHTSTWHYLNHLFQGQADPAAKDATRLSYLPGRTLLPHAARLFKADGAFLQPIPAAPAPPATLRAHEGPVPGWAGPVDDNELITIACHTRTRPDERFGEPIHFAQLWNANEQWLSVRFPGKDGQPWDYTQADMALAGELTYWTGGDVARSIRLLQQSGLAQVRGDDDDWHERKAVLAVERAAENAKQYHFMRKVPAGTTPQAGTPTPEAPDAPPQLTVGGVLLEAPEAPEPPNRVVATALEATVANLNVPVPGAVSKQVTMNDYFGYVPDHTYIHRPSGKECSAASVDDEIGKEARGILIPTVPVHSFTWAPGMPERFTLDKLDPTHAEGDRVWLYNEYRAPRPPERFGDVSPWLELIRKLYPDDVDHIVSYFADAVQAPGRKCNHALVLGSGVHGIGKDTLLAPLQHAVGNRNFTVIKPTALASDFNPFVRHVVVQMSESRDLGEGFNSLSRYDMYERCKDLAAAPPSSLECNEKNKRQYPVANVLRLIITTNHQVDGLYMDPNDRRHYCAWSDAPKMTEAESLAIYAWYEAGGLEMVAHYLHALDLTARGWNRTRAPKRTDWWQQLVEGGRSAEDGKFDDAVDKLQRPEWLTLGDISQAGGTALAGWIDAPANRRKVEREMVKSGYQRLPHPTESRGRWSFKAGRVVVYRRSDVPANQVTARLLESPADR